MDSDTDSDFYGDNETISDLKARVQNYDVAAWWALNLQAQMPMRQLALQKASLDATEPGTAGAATNKTSHLHNPYAGVPYAWQLTETVDEFLARLPPSSTPQTVTTPWVYICNPFIARPDRAESANQQIRGGEDEAPIEQGAGLRTFAEGGMERLHMASEFVQHCRNSGMGSEFVTRECKKAGDDAAVEILDLAHALRVRCGKWMLFRSAEEVDEAWEAVAKATANNELGIAAKVAPRPEEDHAGQKERLICVYTADFKDLEDVRRVARQLKQLGLVPPRGRPIYYKPDAYTYLGISSGNPWSIRASIYDSINIFRKGKS